MHAHSQVYKNIISLDDIKSIIDFYESQPEVETEIGIINKNLEYHIPENFIYQVLKPYMDKILGEDHQFSTGSYKSSSRPYIIHVDSRIQHDAYPDCVSFDDGNIVDNKAVLIPLVEGPEFRTITFAAWTDFNPTRDQIVSMSSKEKNHLRAEDFDHDRSFDVINYLPVDIDYHWQLGDILVWDRNQWHMSSNFAKHNKVKTFLVLFIA